MTAEVRTYRRYWLGLGMAALLRLTPDAVALPADAFLLTSQIPRADRLAGTVLADTARVSGEALQVVRLPFGVAGTVLGILPGVPMTGGKNLARGLAAPFRTAGAVLKVPGHILGAL